MHARIATVIHTMYSLVLGIGCGRGTIFFSPLRQPLTQVSINTRASYVPRPGDAIHLALQKWEGCDHSTIDPYIGDL